MPTYFKDILGVNIREVIDHFVIPYERVHMSFIWLMKQSTLIDWAWGKQYVLSKLLETLRGFVDRE